MSFSVSRGPGNFESGPEDPGDPLKLKFLNFEILEKIIFWKILKWGPMGPTRGPRAPGPLQSKAATQTEVFLAHFLTKIDRN